MLIKVLYQNIPEITFGLSFDELMQDIDNIKSINFPPNCDIQFDQLKKLCDALKNNKSVESIYFVSSNIKDKGADLIANLLKTNKSIKNLDLSFNNISSKGLIDLFDAIKNNTTLELLNLSCNQFNDDLAGYIISQIILYTKSIKYLNLFVNIFSDTGLKFIFEAIAKNTTIEKLYLSQMSLTSDHIKLLANALIANNTLEGLSMRDCDIDDVKAKHIARLIEHNQSLKNLDLRENQINHSGVIAIAKALEKNKSLETLHLSGFVIQQSATKSLAESMIINYKIDVNHLSAHKLPTDKSARKALSYMVQGKFPQEMLLWLVNNKDRVTNTLKLFGISESLANAIVDNSIKEYKFSYNLNKEGSISSDLPGFTFGEYFLAEEITQQISSFRIIAEKSALQDAVQQGPGL